MKRGVFPALTGENEEQFWLWRMCTDLCREPGRIEDRVVPPNESRSVPSIKLWRDGGFFVFQTRPGFYREKESKSWQRKRS
jgi:hypothetical protein